MTSFSKLEQQLKALRAEFIQRIEAIDVDVRHKDEPVEKDFAEQVTQRENDDVLGALDAEAREAVIQIDDALQRMESGEYGNCVGCGVDIPHARLEAVPFSKYCIECAELEDRLH